MPIKIGLIGKTNTGKTTFFNSSTLSSDEISTYPFTLKNRQPLQDMLTHFVFILNLMWLIIQIILDVKMDGDTFLSN